MIESKAKTVNRRLAALRSFIRWLRTQEWQIEYLLEKVERKPEGKQTPRALDAQRVESVNVQFGRVQ